MDLVFASGNLGKYEEIKSVLADHVNLIPQSVFDVNSVAETGTTFVENAIIKARHACQITGLPAIADDSGLMVSSLQNEPGVISARYAGDNVDFDANIDKVLANLTSIDAADRSAVFICVLVFMQSYSDPVPEIFCGTWSGEINPIRAGSNGFGYDPIFYLSEYNCTAAEISFKLKQSISHRAKAIQLLNDYLLGIKEFQDEY